MTVVQSMTVASGATFNLTGALEGYRLYLKSNEARIGERKGVMIIAK